jgi:hypothetical protein
MIDRLVDVNGKSFTVGVRMITLVDTDGMFVSTLVELVVIVGRIFIDEVLVGGLDINSIYDIFEKLFWYLKRTPINGLPLSLIMVVEAIARNSAQVTSSNVIVNRVTCAPHNSRALI